MKALLPLFDEASVRAEVELIELRLMREMLAESLGLPASAPVATITAAARTAIIFHLADEARAA